MRIEYEDDGPVVVEVPGRFEVCDSCDGRGKVDHPAFSNGFTQSEVDEEGPDFMEDYLRGVYDVTCPGCRGVRVVEVPDVARCTFGQKRYLVKARIDARLDAEFRREVEAERRMGC